MWFFRRKPKPIDVLELILAAIDDLNAAVSNLETASAAAVTALGTASDTTAIEAAVTAINTVSANLNAAVTPQPAEPVA